jgi:predicted TIM-barrel fold metal-dependent hydrolase
MNLTDFHVYAGDFWQLADDMRALLVRRPMEPGVDVAATFSEPKKLAAYLAQNGVRRAVVLAECGPGSNFSIDGRMIARFCRGNPIFVPFGNINPHFHDTVAEWEHSVALGIHGFKFYPAGHSFDPLADEMQQVYRRCERFAMPVMFHTGLTAQRDASEAFIRPRDFIPILDRYPDLAVILAHAGKPVWHEEALEVIKRFPNCYLDTALVDPATVAALLDAAPQVAERVLFGSDWPVCGPYSSVVEGLLAQALDQQTREGLMGGNADRLLDHLLAEQDRRGLSVWSQAPAGMAHAG